MGRATGKPPTLGREQINGACVECRKKRTLCINIRRPQPGYATDFGHAALSLGDGEKFETFGNWPSSYTPGVYRSSARGGQSIAPGMSTVKKDFNSLKDPTNPTTDNPENDRRFKERKCKEITEEQEKKLRQAAASQDYNLTDKNCAKWAGSTWNNITGDNLDYGAGNWIYHSPQNLGDSIKGQ